jgi:predicted permease
MPLGLERAVALLADAAVPLVLLSLGIQMSRARVTRPNGLNLAAVGLKLVVMPAVALAVGALIGLRGLDLAILTLLGGMPTAINLAMLAVAFRGDADQVGRTVVLGTLASLATLPILLALLGPVAR